MPPARPSRIIPVPLPSSCTARPTWANRLDPHKSCIQKVTQLQRTVLENGVRTDRIEVMLEPKEIEVSPISKALESFNYEFLVDSILLFVIFASICQHLYMLRRSTTSLPLQMTVRPGHLIFASICQHLYMAWQTW